MIWLQASGRLLLANASILSKNAMNYSRLTRSRLLQFLAYSCVGVAGTGVQYALLFMLVSIGAMGPVFASCVGAIAGAVVNYLLNYTFTFKNSGHHRDVAPRFFAVAAFGVAVNSILMLLLAQILRIPYLLAQCATTGCTLVLTYIVNSMWSFKAKRIGGDSTSSESVDARVGTAAAGPDKGPGS